MTSIQICGAQPSVLHCSSRGNPAFGRQHPSIASRVESNLAATAAHVSNFASWVSALRHSFCSAFMWGCDAVRAPKATLLTLWDKALIYLGITTSSNHPSTTIWADLHSGRLGISACATAFTMAAERGVGLCQVRVCSHAFMPCPTLLSVVQACSCPNLSNRHLASSCLGRHGQFAHGLQWC